MPATAPRPAPQPPPPPALHRVDLAVADAVGALMELWGFRRQLGRGGEGVPRSCFLRSPSPIGPSALSASGTTSGRCQVASWPEASRSVIIWCPDPKVSSRTNR
jgi:hypothetical protein